MSFPVHTHVWGPIIKGEICPYRICKHCKLPSAIPDEHCVQTSLDLPEEEQVYGRKHPIRFINGIYVPSFPAPKAETKEKNDVMSPDYTYSAQSNVTKVKINPQYWGKLEHSWKKNYK